MTPNLLDALDKAAEIHAELADLRRRYERLEAAAREANVILNSISDDMNVSNRTAIAARAAAVVLSEAMKEDDEMELLLSAEEHTPDDEKIWYQ